MGECINNHDLYVRAQRCMISKATKNIHYNSLCHRNAVLPCSPAPSWPGLLCVCLSPGCPGTQHPTHLSSDSCTDLWLGWIPNAGQAFPPATLPTETAIFQCGQIPPAYRVDSICLSCPFSLSMFFTQPTSAKWEQPNKGRGPGGHAYILIWAKIMKRMESFVNMSQEQSKTKL